MNGFWAFMHMINALPSDTVCVAKQNTDTQHVVYGGNCVQAFQTAILSHGRYLFDILH